MVPHVMDFLVKVESKYPDCITTMEDIQIGKVFFSYDVGISKPLTVAITVYFSDYCIYAFTLREIPVLS